VGLQTVEIYNRNSRKALNSRPKMVYSAAETEIGHIGCSVAKVLQEWNQNIDVFVVFMMPLPTEIFTDDVIGLRKLTPL
jgi:hypothetical protein